MASPPLADPSALPKGFEHCFVEASLAGGPSWARATGVTLVESAPSARITRSSMPVLNLSAPGAADLVRALHLYLVPLRQAGVAPLMEKGAVILGEKLMDMNNLGLFLDRISAYFGQVDRFRLIERIPDLRQVLSALVLEAWRCAKKSGVLHPAVDFQVAATTSKIAVNLRFAAGGLTPSSLTELMLAGGDLYWSQAWQCSDFALLTHHAQHDELEALFALFRPERAPFGEGRSLLFRRLDSSPRKANLLTAPDSYTFKLVSEVRAKDSAQLMLSDSDAESAAADIDMSGLPPEIVSRINRVKAEMDVLREQLRGKEALLQEAATRSHETNRELNAKRAEVVRATRQIEAETQKADRRVAELEAKLATLQAANEKAADRTSTSGAVPAEMVKQMESMLRSAENEREKLKESAANEKRKAGLLEQKYATLFRDAAQKDREILELKNVVSKFRKDATSTRSKQMEANASSEHGELSVKLRETEEREQQLKTEVKKLSFRLEHQEKGMKAFQTEASEKQRLLEGKLKETKQKEMELLRRLEELSSSLKKAQKAA